MFTSKTCTEVPVEGGRLGGGGLVEVEGRAVWGGHDGVYVLDEASSKWERVADGVRWGATLAVCGGELVSVGGSKVVYNSNDVVVWRGERWTFMSNMLVECRSPSQQKVLAQDLPKILDKILGKTCLRLAQDLVQDLPKTCPRCQDYGCQNLADPAKDLVQDLPKILCKTCPRSWARAEARLAQDSVQEY